MYDSLLDAYILSLFDRGFETAYDLQTHGGISLGSSVPALKRMESSGLIERKASANNGKRSRYAFSLTEEGRQIVQRCWASLLATPPPGDLDSVLRTVDILKTYRVAPRHIAKYLSQASANRAKLASKASSNHLSSTPGAGYLADRLRWDLQRARAEAKFLSQLAKSVV